MPEHPGIPQPSAEIRERVSKHVWIKLTGPAAASLTEALCQSVAGLQENVSAKVVTPREEDAAHKDDGRVKPVTVPPTMIVMEGKGAGAQKYIKVEKIYRIVLLGDTKIGKSSLANSMFGEDVFKVNNTECQSESKSVHGRRITLINTPDFSGPGRSEEELKPEIMRCITECTAGPHAFLIVLKVEKSTELQQQKLQVQAVTEKIIQYFSEEVFKYATVVFIQDGPDSDEMKVKEFIVQNKYVGNLVKKCKSRYHIINKYNQQGDSSQSKVAELLNTIDQVVKENKGVCYSNKMMPQGDICNKANSSISKNEMIKLAGAAAESVAKALSGSAVVVLTPGSTTTGKEKDGTETDKKEENGDGKATSEITNNGQKEMTKEEEEGGRKNEEDATSEKMNDEQTEMTKEGTKWRRWSSCWSVINSCKWFICWSVINICWSVINSCMWFICGLSTAAGVSVVATAVVESVAGAAETGASAGTAGVGGGAGAGAGAGTAGAGGAAGAGAGAGTAGAGGAAGAGAGTARAGGAAARYVAAAAGGAVGVAWLIQKIRNVIEWIKQQLRVVLLVLVFYSLLLSWFFLKVPFVGTLFLSFLLLLLVIILVII